MANATLQGNVAQEMARRRVADELMPRIDRLRQQYGIPGPELPQVPYTTFDNSIVSPEFMQDMGSGDAGTGTGVSSASTAAPTSVAPSGNVVGPVGFTTAFTNALTDNPALAIAPLGMVALTAMALSNMNAPDNSIDADGPAPGSATSAADAATTAANAVAADGPAPGSGDGGGGGGGKIVCTAMNQAYGFGSFRQAIWLKYSASNLTRQHERGYHRIFRPLVKYAFHSGDGFLKRHTKAFLEKIMRLRTADLRAEMRGKNPHPAQRIIRRMCERICYMVGKS